MRREEEKEKKEDWMHYVMCMKGEGGEGGRRRTRRTGCIQNEYPHSVEWWEQKKRHPLSPTRKA